MFKIKNSTLKEFSTKHYNNKHFYVYQQLFKNIPVINAFIKVTLLDDGTIGRMSSSFIENIDIDITPNISEVNAQNIALNIYNISENDSNSFNINNNGLFIYFDTNSDKTKLCWKVILEGNTYTQERLSQSILIDAKNGDIIENISQIMNGSGTVYIPAYSGEFGSSSNPPDMLEYAKNLKIRAIGDNFVDTYTDDSGYYTANPTNFDHVSSMLEGRYVKVYLSIYLNQLQQTSTSFTWTWDSDTDTDRHLYHMYYWLNEARDDFYNNVSGFSTNYYCSNPILAVAYNYDFYNASWDGTYIRLGAYHHQPFGLYHEYSHAINGKNFVGGTFLSTNKVIDEALADYFACTLLNDPTPPIYGDPRDISTNVYYEYYDYLSTPYGKSLILSGACWDLQSSLGESITNALIYETIHSISYNESMPDFMDELLLSDDNDGNISNGTPHDNYIFNAFNANHHILGNYLGGELTENITLSGNVYILEDLTIPDGCVLTCTSNTTVHVANGKHINVYGELDVANGVTFTKAIGGSYWEGIVIESGGVIDANGDFTVEYAECGLIFYSGTISYSTPVNLTTIQNCSIAGVYIYNCSPAIINMNFINAGAQYGSVCVIGSTSNPPIQSCTSQGSKSALYFGYNSNGSVDYFNIKNTHTSYPVYAGYPSSISLTGMNNILKATGISYAVANGPNGFIEANNNWWGVNPPPSSYFPWYQEEYIEITTSRYTFIDTTQTGIYKTAIQEKKPYELAQEYEFTGSINKAVEIYESSLLNESNPWKKKLIVTSLLRAVNNGDKDYDSLRNIINRELKTADSYYEATLDAILCELLIYEGKHHDAITLLYEKAEKYKDTAIEVEFLARISMVYGKVLNDNNSAIAVAESAKSINPGQEILRAAFDSANQDYKPWLSPNKYINETELIKHAEEKLDKVITHNANITLSPNPFNPSTTLSYSITKSEHVTLSVYSMTGQKVSTLVDDIMDAGTYSAIFNGSGLASGIYFYHFKAGDKIITGRMTLVK